MEQRDLHGQGLAVTTTDGVVLTCTCGWMSSPQPTGYEAGRAFDEHRTSVTARR